ncbi:hypothetical protein O6H91_16G089800 [Diphasiastrum complanatum]|uniref:Uncharacterized protein n=1 Tax=Diphasiastrum complanatum TaxID=34168 RepID=A0ACC2BFG2_DIPCM|nr:hypothetical protein O6H91_16G089800 [Diphasiastrum complanatum]
MDYIEDVQEPQHSEGTSVNDDFEDDYIATSLGKIVFNPFILFFHKNNERCRDNLNSLCIDRAAIQMRGEMCAVRADICKIVRKTNSKPSKKLKHFCMRKLNPNLTIDLALVDVATMLIWADFPTLLCVKHYGDNKTVPTSTDLVVVTFEITNTYVVSHGWFACTSLSKHFPVVDSFAEASGFSLDRCLNILCKEGYVRHNPREEVNRQLAQGCLVNYLATCWPNTFLFQVVLLVTALYHHTRCPTPTIHRREANQVDIKAFSTMANWVMDLNSATLTTVDDVI